MVQNATQYGLRVRALDAKWSNRKVYSSEHLAQPAAEATVAAGEYVLAHQLRYVVLLPPAYCSFWRMYPGAAVKGLLAPV